MSQREKNKMTTRQTLLDTADQLIAQNIFDSLCRRNY